MVDKSAEQRAKQLFLGGTQVQRSRLRVWYVQEERPITRIRAVAIFKHQHDTLEQLLVPGP